MSCPSDFLIASLTVSASVVSQNLSRALRKYLCPLAVLSATSPSSWIILPMPKENTSKTVKPVPPIWPIPTTKACQPRSKIHPSQMAIRPGKIKPRKSYSSSFSFEKSTLSSCDRSGSSPLAWYQCRCKVGRPWLREEGNSSLHVGGIHVPRHALIDLDCRGIGMSVLAIDPRADEHG